MTQLTEHRHKNDLVHRHAQWDGMEHEHDSAAMIEAGLGNFPSGPVVVAIGSVERASDLTKRRMQGEPEAITRVASLLAQIIEDEGPRGAWVLAQAAHDAILQRSRMFREHGYTLQARSEANALAYLAHLIGEAVRAARA